MKALIATLIAALGIAIGATAAAYPCSSIGAHNASTDKRAARVCKRVVEAADRHDVPRALVVAVAMKESHMGPGELAGGGCIGPMQIQPRHHCPRRLGSRLRWCDLWQSVEVGVAYLAELVERHGTDGGLARYRVGPRNYRTDALARAQGSKSRGRRWADVGDDYAADVRRIRAELGAGGEG